MFYNNDNEMPFKIIDSSLRTTKIIEDITKESQCTTADIAQRGDTFSFVIIPFIHFNIFIGGIKNAFQKVTRCHTDEAL